MTAVFAAGFLAGVFIGGLAALIGADVVSAIIRRK